ncbi:MAG TPA: hypothetical protein VEI57_14940 [Nitrospirota bacterium]|nr:hypothetical protein [Nitrospirota bacterium]
MPSSSPYGTAIKKRSVRNLFLVNFLIFIPFTLSVQANAQAATPPGYSLVGTIRGEDFSGAVIIVSKGEQSFFRLFDKLPDGSQIIEVRTDNIVLRGTDGMTYEMYILHETKNVAAVPYSQSDPFAGATGKTRSERLIGSYQRQHPNRAGQQTSDDE